MNTNPVIGSLSSLVQALNDGDAEYVLDEALDLQDDGAQILEIDFSLPGIHKTDSLLSVIRDLQEIISLPLKITASDPSILSQAVRIYNGNPLTCLVSVTENINYEEESFEL